MRTGETYVYDTPYHVGNSPAAGNKTADLWVSFITFLREEVCVKHQKALFFRAWDNWPSEASYCTVRRLDPTTTKGYAACASASLPTTQGSPDGGPLLQMSP